MSFVPFQPKGYPFGWPVDTTHAIRPLKTTTLEGKYCRVRPLNPEVDAPLLYNLVGGSAQNESVFNYMYFGPFPTLPSYLEYLTMRAQSTTDVVYVVESKESGLPVGSISYMNIETVHQSIEIGSIYYATTVQRTAINTEVCYLLIKHALEDLKFRRIEWKANALNEKSRKAAARMGFTFEGIFRSHRISKGCNRDTIWFSLLRDEWEPVKANYETWLYSNPEWKLSLAVLNGNKYAGPAPVSDDSTSPSAFKQLAPCGVESVDVAAKTAKLHLP